MATPSVVIDPLAFALRATGGVSRVWTTVLPRLLEGDLDIRLTSGVDARTLLTPGWTDHLERFEPGHRLAAGIRRFVPFRGEAAVFFPTANRPCDAGVRNIQLIHDCIKELLYPPVKAGLARMRRGRLYRGADALISVSESTRFDVYRLYGNAVGDHVQVIHNPVDHGYIHRMADAEDGRTEFESIMRAVGGRPFAVFIGHRGGVKNFSESRHLLQALPEHALVVIGPDPSDEERELARTLDSRIMYAGRCSDTVMFKLLRASQFLFFPSVMEGFGLPIIESLFLGTPVLALDTQINREVSAGLLNVFQLGSGPSMAAAAGQADRIPADHPTVQSLIRRYDPQRVGERYLDAVKQFL